MTYFISKDQVCVKRNQVRVRRSVKTKAAELMNKLSEDDLQHCFQQWKIRMERFKDRGGEYIEGDNISIV